MYLAPHKKYNFLFPDRGHYDRRDGGGRGRGGYHGDGGHGGDGGHRKDKFPNYLNHIPPEEDPLATRYGHLC